MGGGGGGQKLNMRTLGGRCIGLVCSAQQLPRGVWGHAPPGIFLEFRPSEVISGAFSDHITCADKALEIQLAGIITCSKQ